MAKRGGFPGGMPGNMNNMLKQAQRMQRQMEEQQKELEEKEFTGTAGGGAVSVVITGKNLVNELNQRLIEDGRMEDLKRACQETEYQKELLKEYGFNEE